MRLTRLQVHCVRNLQEVALHPHPQFNLFLGPNGSGKTSLLEAIYLLALGRSFRSRHLQSLLTYQEERLACFGEIVTEENTQITIGFERNRQGEMQCKLSGERCEKLSVFAKTLPVQLITPDSFKLLQAGPEERRRFWDWGAFYSDPQFATLCMRYGRLLKQRNAALKQSARGQSLVMWEKELVPIGAAIAASRSDYFHQLLPFLEEKLAFLLPGVKVEFSAEQGWKAGSSLAQALQENLPQDQRYGYTTVGPHRADLIVMHQHFPAKEVLSRGQQKLLVCACYLAQAQHLAHTIGKKCLFLIDDLASELDHANRQRLVQYLLSQHYQVFITGVDSEQWQATPEQYAQKYYVKQGHLISTSPHYAFKTFL